MNETNFHIAIIDQGWIDESLAQEDLYSHGHIDLTIAGKTISDRSQKYGIIDSALALLRTLAADHTPDHPLADRLILHDCATIPMMTCPMGINWDVVHWKNIVQIQNIIVFPSTIESKAVHFYDLAVRVPFDLYKDEIVAFAKAAQSLYYGVSKTFEDQFEAEQYQQFWHEFDTTLNIYTGAT